MEIQEAVPVTAGLSRFIMAGGNALELVEQQEKTGIHALCRAALIRAAQGAANLKEADRLT